MGPLSFIDDYRGFGIYKNLTNNAPYLVETDDGGFTWKVVTTMPLSSYPSRLEFIDAQTGYAWGDGTLYVTHDGGAQWLDSLTVAGGGQAVSPIGSNLWALTNSAVEASANGGTNWTPLAKLPLSSPSSLSRVSTTVAYVFGCLQTPSCNSNGLVRTEDGGQSWQMTSLPQNGIAQGLDLIALSIDDLWLVEFSQPATDESSKWVYRSYDGGDHWTLVASVVLPSGPFHVPLPRMGDFGPLSVIASVPNRAWLSFDRGGVWATTDGGADWMVAFPDPDADAEGPPYVSFLDADHGWAATGIGLWRTTDGSHWVEVAPPS